MFARIDRLAFGADAKSAATDARRSGFVARSGDQVEGSGGEILETFAGNHTFAVSSGDDLQFVQTEVTIGSDTDGVRDDDATVTGLDVFEGGGEIALTIGGGGTTSSLRAEFVVGITVGDDEQQLGGVFTTGGELFSSFNHTARDAGSAATAAFGVFSVANTVVVARLRTSDGVDGGVDVGLGDTFGHLEGNPSVGFEVNEGEVSSIGSVFELVDETGDEFLLVSEFDEIDRARTIENQGKIDWFTALAVRWGDEGFGVVLDAIGKRPRSAVGEGELGWYAGLDLNFGGERNVLVRLVGGWVDLDVLLPNFRTVGGVATLGVTSGEFGIGGVEGWHRIAGVSSFARASGSRAKDPLVGVWICGNFVVSALETNVKFVQFRVRYGTC